MLESTIYVLSLKMTCMYKCSKCPCTENSTTVQQFSSTETKESVQFRTYVLSGPAWWALWGAEVDRPFFGEAYLLTGTSHCRCWQIWHGVILAYRLEKSPQKNKMALKCHLKDREVERNENRICWPFYSCVPALEQPVWINWCWRRFSMND